MTSGSHLVGGTYWTGIPPTVLTMLLLSAVREGTGVTREAQQGLTASASNSFQDVPALLQGLDHAVDQLRLGGAVLLSLPETPDQLGLPICTNLAVARKGRQDLLVSEVLAPSFELLGCPA